MLTLSSVVFLHEFAINRHHNILPSEFIRRYAPFE